jgi:hypothetical protein
VDGVAVWGRWGRGVGQMGSRWWGTIFVTLELVVEGWHLSRWASNVGWVSSLAWLRLTHWTHADAPCTHAFMDAGR